MNTKKLEKLEPDDQIKLLFTKEKSFCPIIFIQDGQDPTDSKTKSYKINLSTYIKKYFVRYPSYVVSVPLE
jgi:hypothetical protein